LFETITHSEFSENQLFSLLTNSERAPNELLPKTGVPLELEILLSSIFIKSEEYGTVSSTVLLVDNLGGTEMVEYSRRINAEGFTKSAFRLQLRP
jgi:uncharacterized protein with NRDE domain